MSRYLKRDGFAGNFMKITRRKVLNYFTRTATAVTIAGPASLLTYGQYLQEKAGTLPKKECDGLAILISKPINVIELFGIQFIDSYVSRIELALGCKANTFCENATSNDFREALENEKIAHIAIMGHGTRYSWQASDKTVTLEDYADIAAKGIRKKGYLLKHTCGKMPLKYYSPWAVTKETEEEAEYWAKKLDKKTDSIIREILCPRERLFAKKPKEYQQFIETAPKIKREVLGTPIYPENKIAYWNRITSPIDFMLNPLAHLKQKKESGHKQTAHTIASRNTARGR